MGAKSKKKIKGMGCCLWLEKKTNAVAARFLLILAWATVADSGTLNITILDGEELCIECVKKNLEKKGIDFE